ncbi:unnamed protein product [Periconia digitata]|uniref:Uncharacterized protein n=1 Tax=Periconia digitata TaxID=1303443 RepID=A0A9W4URF7_9PLEO|nr:unnamed protein product [Periconia digitata]
MTCSNGRPGWMTPAADDQFGSLALLHHQPISHHVSPNLNPRGLSSIPILPWKHTCNSKLSFFSTNVAMPADAACFSPCKSRPVNLSSTVLVSTRVLILGDNDTRLLRHIQQPTIYITLGSPPYHLPLPSAGETTAPEKIRTRRSSISKSQAKTKVKAKVKVKVEPSSKPSLPVRRSSRLRYIKDLITAMPSYIRETRASRAYSFPPCVDSIDVVSPQDTELPDIDEEPFAHFLTPVSEYDNPQDPLSLSAGIMIPDGKRTSKASKFKSNVADKWTRYVKTNHTQLHARYHAPIPEEDEESFMSLEDDRLYAAPQPVSQLSSPPRITVTEPTRGRAQELVTRKARTRRRYSRTLSGHRHSWREPSPDLWTVDESEEEDLPVLRRAKKKSSKDSAERRRSSKSRVRGEVAEKSRL